MPCAFDLCATFALSLTLNYVASTCILQSLPTTATTTTTTATSCSTTRRTQRPHARKERKRIADSAFPSREPDKRGNTHRARTRWWQGYLGNDFGSPREKPAREEGSDDSCCPKVLVTTFPATLDADHAFVSFV